MVVRIVQNPSDPTKGKGIDVPPMDTTADSVGCGKGKTDDPLILALDDEITRLKDELSQSEASSNHLLSEHHENYAEAMAKIARLKADNCETRKICDELHRQDHEYRCEVAELQAVVDSRNQEIIDWEHNYAQLQECKNCLKARVKSDPCNDKECPQKEAAEASRKDGE